MTAVKYFDGRETGNSGLYIQPCDTIFINAYLDDIDKKKVLYHEMGHVGQYLENYSFLKEKFEAQADRNMIHHLLKEYIPTLDFIEDFNVCRFMDAYRLKTICDEQMVMNEFKNLI
ncbi:ImmA/IrrE family metallo-endopeptidase [Streptococcus iniae]|uniref:ImmA/IrrE family metallo-endopeptidase n=1 Tax=Streptococcus iniae TaxID=1346 RepID=UPI000EF7171E|nr:ImmA/IrrE family metallo-endopeptidase [Streptococcus iniae]RLU51171.1 ImmA/IrrE family metallo-endopeptidase [Streptococcus iniae]RLU57909.1 ImmA/IrrE family metallo-endopeptidase [Streptococcus iniae]RLU59895.1 ImmA/IrrE family metallo-endopeptidase [Streptococcus iniae]RLU82118.1 ImmA/IrrE family metallo-endopeptidase [Streptococcus iniae]RLU82657.1 ImmA/IrrE family metallo-endopeptidase [Streptococcus iniae]